MDNDDQTIGRILTRREALAAVAGTGVAALFLSRAKGAGPAAAPATRPASLVVAPQLTEGPFFVDERLNRSDLIAGSTRPSVAGGLPLALTLTVAKLAGGAAVPLAGAVVDLWHADGHGVYSDEDDPMNAEDTAGQRWLRGYQVTDAAGRVTFRTIVPGWYDGRAAHVHFKVRQFKAGPTTAPAAAARPTAEFTSQLFFAEADLDAIYAHAPYAGRGERQTRNADDGIYNEPLADGTPAGATMTLALRDAPAGRGKAAAIDLYLTDAAMHGGGGDHGGPGGPGGGPGGRGRPPGPPPGRFRR